MQKILSFNTIFSGVSIILQDEKKIVDKKYYDTNKQSEILVKSIYSILNENNLDFFNIDVFSTIVGPGNFTGIKTSLAVLKALKMSTNKKIITNNTFEIISYGIDGYDIVILDMGTAKYFIKNSDDYLSIYKKDINDFLEQNKGLRILTNDNDFKGQNIIHSEFNDQKWSELVYHKFSNNIFTEDIQPLYIEEALVTKRKS